mgnify:CR=1 FL=1
MLTNNEESLLSETNNASREIYHINPTLIIQFIQNLKLTVILPHH